MAEKKEQNNLLIYEKARQVPKTALKQIINGRLKGKSDINPMFRIKRITEIFGPCGFGWRYEIVNQWLEPFNNQVKAFTQINLFIKMNGEWSAAIPGVGGADFVAQEKSGPYVNDECYKMSLTDALSVAMKALGIAADVYWDKDGGMVNTDSKYAYNTIQQPQQKQAKIPQPEPKPYADIDFEAELLAEAEANKCGTVAELADVYNKYAKMNPAYVREGSVFMKALTARKKTIQSQPKTTLF